MNKKITLTLSMLLLVFTSLATGLEKKTTALATSPSTTEEAPCDCEDVPEPRIDIVEVADDCEVKFIAANYGPTCWGAATFQWSVNGGAPGPSNISPTFVYSSLDNLTSLELTVNYSSGGPSFCQKTAFKWLENYTCENAAGTDVMITKEAFNNAGAPVSSVYQGSKVNWVITINNMTGNTINDVEFTDTFFLAPGTTDPPCGWTFENPFSAVVHTSGPTGDIVVTTSFPLSATFDLLPGETTITIEMDTPNNANCLGLYLNCARVDYTIDMENFAAQSCAPVNIVYGCPVGMTDGWCLDEDEIEAGDMLTSYFSGHTEFLNVKTITGRITYDPAIVEDPILNVEPSLGGSFAITPIPLGPGIMDFVMTGTSPGNSFDINSPLAGGVWQPFSLDAELKNDLVGCLVFSVNNVQIDDGFGVPTDVFVDPGTFCDTYPIYYDQAVIGVSPNFGACASTSEPVTLTAIGPFDSQDPGISFSWKKDGVAILGGTGQDLTVTTGANYSVEVTDINGCIRNADIDIESCEENCECGNLGAVVVADVDGCLVEADVIMPLCLGLSDVTYKWYFSNGNAYVGANPPVQNFAGPTNGDPSIVLKLYYTLNGESCEESIINDVFVPCRGSGGPAGKSIALFPNPAKDQVQLSIDDQKLFKGSVRVLNAMGRSLITQSYELLNARDAFTLDTSGLRPGLYFVQILDDTGSVVEIKRLAIQ